MTPEEAEIIRDIFDRVRRMGPVPRDPAARDMIERELAANPDAVMGLVRAVVALDRERAQLIEENRALHEERAGPAGGGLFGDPAGGPQGGYGGPQDGYGGPQGGYGGPPRREPWGSPPWGTSRAPQPEPQPQPGPWGGRTPDTGGGGILGTVVGAATGMAGGLFAYEALKGLFGGSNHQGGGGLFGGSAHASERGGESSGTEKFVTGGDMDQGGDFFDLFGDGDDL